MPRPRDPRRYEAKKKWLESNGTYVLKDLAKEIGVTSSTIRKWKATDQWENELKGSAPIPKKSAPKPKGAPKGNQNARGNKGGRAPGGNQNAKGNAGGAAPPNNKNAIVTGEYETIYEDVLSEEERSLFYGMDTSPITQIEENIRLLAIRERRMLQRISSTVEGMTQKGKRVLQELKKVKEPVEVQDEQSGKKKIITRPKEELVVTELEEKEYRIIDDILRIEEALTLVQNQKIKAIKMKHEMEQVFLHNQYMDYEKLRVEKEKADAMTKETNQNEEEIETWTSAIQEVAKKRREKLKKVNNA